MKSAFKSDIKSAFKSDYLEEHDEIVEKARAANRALNFLQTVAANLNNEALTDEQFRDFMRRSMADMPGVNHAK